MNFELPLCLPPCHLPNMPSIAWLLVVWSWYLGGMLSNLKFPQASFSLNINYYFDISSPVRIICILLFVWHIPFTRELSSARPDFCKKILQTSCSFINSISLATRGIILNNQHYLSSQVYLSNTRIEETLIKYVTGKYGGILFTNGITIKHTKNRAPFIC